MSQILVITYDLHAVADYSALYAFLEEHGAFSLSDSTWLVCTEDDAETWYERIEQVYYDMTLVVLPLGDGGIGGSDEEIEEFIASCSGDDSGTEE
jgi:hypothetical protein